MTDTGEGFATAIRAEFRRRMLEEYVPRIEGCVERLSEEQFWLRPGPHSNSIGALVVHLEGNVRQWVLAGIRGDDDGRDRDSEFASSGGSANASPAELVARLRSTVTEAVEVVESMRASRMLESWTFQGRFEETGVGAVLHVVEHFSGHAGQIYAFTKQVAQVDLKHYDL